MLGLGTLSNMGFRMAMHAVNTSPTVADLLNGIESKSGSGWSTNVVEVSTVDGDGYSKKIGLLKTGKDITVKFWKEDADTYQRLYSQYHDIPTSDPAAYVALTFMSPKRSDWSGVKDYTQVVQITDFSEGDVNTTDAQSYSVTFTPSGKPTVFNGMGAITGVTANPDTLTEAGGPSVVTVAGTNLLNGLLVRVYDADNNIVMGTSTYTTGTNVSQTATVDLPINAGSTDLTYTVKVSVNNGSTWDAITDTITVAAGEE